MKADGRRGEEIAARFLQSQGCEILERNFRSKYGEIDILARDGAYLIVVEVKSRSGTKMGRPAEAVDYRKQQKIQKTFQYYRMRHQVSEFSPVRFDVIEIFDARNCNWIKNAFLFA